MATVSLNMLKKGAKAPPPPKEEPKVEEQAKVTNGEGADEELSFDVDKMTGKQIDQMVIDNELEVPDGWKTMPVAEKRKYLNERYAAGDDEQPEAEDEDGEAEEGEVAPAKGVTPGEPPKPAAAAKSTAVATAPKAAKPSQIIKPGEDAIIDIVHEVENLDEKSAREAVGVLKETAEVTFLKLGGVLSRIQSQNWFEPHGSFKDYIENEHGLKYRRAMKWVEIYNNLAESGIAWTSVQHLGWTKLGVISGVLTKANVNKWVKLAEKNTAIKLEDIVKTSQAKDAPKAIEDQASSTVTTLTFKLHEDQKETINAALEKAKEISGTTVATAALEFICTEYMAGGTGEINWPVVMKKAGYEKVLEVFGEVFPDIGLEVTIPD